jgi:hypothetical protein
VLSFTYIVIHNIIEFQNQIYLKLSLCLIELNSKRLWKKAKNLPINKFILEYSFHRFVHFIPIVTFLFRCPTFLCKPSRHSMCECVRKLFLFLLTHIICLLSAVLKKIIYEHEWNNCINKRHEKTTTHQNKISQSSSKIHTNSTEK